MASLVLTSGLRLVGQEIVINEILANNRSTAVIDEFPEYFPDFVELLNTTTNDIDLGSSGYALADNKETFLFKTGTWIPAKGRLVVLCDGETNMPGIHTMFGLAASSGDAAVLLRGGLLMESNYFGIQAADLSLGRVPDGSGSWQLVSPTPCGGTDCVTNLPVKLGSPLALRINEWLAFSTSGNQTNDDWFEIFNPETNAVALEGLVLRDSNPANTSIVARLSFVGPAHFVQFIANNRRRDADEVNFSLSSSGGDEIWILAGDTSTIIDKVVFGAFPTANVSRGRVPDGGTNIIALPRLSPLESNFGSITNVVINEILPHTDPPLEDAIELHNPTGSAIDISYWWISNAADDPQKFQIPPGTVIAPGGYKVFYEGDFNPDGSGVNRSFTLNSARGDEVVLMTGDANGDLTGFRRITDFGPSENGVSFGRFATSVGTDIVAMRQRSFGKDSNVTSIAQFRMGTGAQNSPPLVGPLVINEIHYHPPDIGTNDNVLDEFLEFLNVSSNRLYLYDPAYPTNTWNVDGDVRFDFPPNSFMEPGEYALVVNFDPTNSALRSEFVAKFDIPPGVQILGPYRGKLSNRQAALEIRKPDTPQAPGRPDAGLVPYIRVERIRYEDRGEWPAQADGTGMSLQRRTPTEYGNEPLNWHAQPPSPGRANIGSCIISLDHSTAAFAGIGGSSNVAFTTGMDCSWTIVNPNNWIAITSASSGTDDATVTYSVDANRTARSRSGSFTIGDALFTVTQARGDASKPTVAITAPAANARLFTAVTNIQGTAKDDMELAMVQVSVNSNAFQMATGTTTWTVPVELIPGLNLIQVKSVDLFGNESTMVSRTLSYVVTDTISVETNGSGSITPVLNGQNLEIGQTYTLTAVPGAGHVFSNWTRGGGSVASTSARLTFGMESNLMLTANFVPNPFADLKGSYNGLFSEGEPDGVQLESSGLLTLLVTDKGAFTGKLHLGPRPISVRGQFDLDGRSAIDVVRRGLSTLRLELEMNLGEDNPQITGKVADPEQWEAPLMLDRATYSKTMPAPWAGSYTVVLPGDLNDPTAPDGDGFATLVVDASGNVRLTGTLADNTKITQRVPVSANGQWPLYVSLYRGLGSLLGWINLDTNAVSTNMTSWIKLSQPKAKLYGDGFTNEPTALVSIYRAPINPANAVEIADGIAAFAGGNLAEPFTNNIAFGPNNRITNGGPQNLKLTITSKSGLFKGTVTPPGATRAVPFQGVLLQRGNTGHGFLTGTNQSSQVVVEEAP